MDLIGPCRIGERIAVLLAGVCVILCGALCLVRLPLL